MGFIKTCLFIIKYFKYLLCVVYKINIGNILFKSLKIILIFNLVIFIKIIF